MGKDLVEETGDISVDINAYGFVVESAKPIASGGGCGSSCGSSCGSGSGGSSDSGCSC